MSLKKIISPCEGICSINKKSNFCIGCGRTIEQISKWSNFNETKKKKIILQIKNRTMPKNISTNKLNKRNINYLKNI
ncbi:DUF1289 domain-containing protein [Candidatus Pelagibacter sp.]|nr:DUF1289 domain-containing protein [Candidatus Pelagibacter sp.]